MNAYYKTELLKIRSKKDKSIKVQYELAKTAVDSLKPIAKKYYEVGFDSMISMMIAKQNMNPADAIKFKEKMNMNIH